MDKEGEIQELRNLIKLMSSEIGELKASLVELRDKPSETLKFKPSEINRRFKNVPQFNRSHFTRVGSHIDLAKPIPDGAIEGQVLTYDIPEGGANPTYLWSDPSGLPDGATADKYLLCTDVVDGLPVYAWVNKVVNTNTWTPVIGVAGQGSGDTLNNWYEFKHVSEENKAQLFSTYVDEKIFKGGPLTEYANGVGGVSNVNPLTIKDGGLLGRYMNADAIGGGLGLINKSGTSDGTKQIVNTVGIFLSHDDDEAGGYNLPILGLRNSNSATIGNDRVYESIGLRWYLKMTASGLSPDGGLSLLYHTDVFAPRTTAGAKKEITLKGAENATSGQAFGKKEDGSFGFITAGLPSGDTDNQIPVWNNTNGAWEVKRLLGSAEV